MPRVYEVKKARASKRTRTCRTCGHVIVPGESYRYFEPRHGPPVLYCHEHYPRRSHMTSSAMGTLYDVQDDFDVSEVETLEDIKAAVESVAETAREVAAEYEDSISRMPEGLQESSPTAETMREKIEALEAYADELENWEPSTEIEEAEEFDEEAAREEIYPEVVSEMVQELTSEELAKLPEEETVEDEDALRIVWDISEYESLESSSDFADRLEEKIADRRNEWQDNLEERKEALTQALDSAREEAQEAVNNFEY